LQLQPYLEGKRFVIRTDHHALKWVLSLADAQGRLARWRLRLLEFDFKVQYSPGKAHFAADTLSRLEPADPEVSCPRTLVDEEIPCFSVQDPDVQERMLQRLDPTLLPVGNLLEEQASDTLCRQLSTLVGAHPSIDFDEFGAVGHVLPSE
jgi:hypothetical protein